MTRSGVVLCVTLLVACVHEMPPPAAPSATLPPVGPLPAAPAGRGRIIVDVTDGPTEVRSVPPSSIPALDGRRRFLAPSVSTERLCLAPCVLDLPYGRHLLAFPVRGGRGRLELAQVEVGSTPTVYRRALGSYEPGGPLLTWSIVGLALGSAAVITGIPLLSLGLATDDDERESFTIGGGATLAAGVIVTTLAILGISESPIVVRPGAETQFSLPP